MYILHSETCRRARELAGEDLRACIYSIALDNGIDPRVWERGMDQPVYLGIRYGERDKPTLVPAGLADGRAPAQVAHHAQLAREARDAARKEPS